MRVAPRLFALSLIFLLPIGAGLAAGTPRPDDPVEEAAFEALRLRDPANGEIPNGIHRTELEFARGLPSRGASLAEEVARSRGHLGKISPWSSRGPHDLGGRTRALAFDVSDPTHQTMFAGATSGGMWRTTDGGATWKMTTAPWQLHSVTDIAQDTRPGHENTWYYSTGELRVNTASQWYGVYRGDGVFKSTDGGLNWTLLPSTSTDDVEFDNPFDYTWGVATDPSNLTDEEVYAASYYGIHRSVDGGASWDFVLGDLGVLAAYTDVQVNSSGIVYAGIRTEGSIHGLFRSEDGVNWTDLTPPGVSSNWLITAIAAPSDENTVYVLVNGMNVQNAPGFFKYDETSGVWENRTSSILALPPNGWDYDPVNAYAMVLAIKPDDPDAVFLGGLNLTRSTNGFADTTQRTWVGGWEYPNHEHWFHAMVFHPDDPKIAYTASDGGLHRTDDVMAANVQWTSIDNDYTTSMFWSVALDPKNAGSDVVVGGVAHLGSFLSYDPDPGLSWQRLHYDSGMVTAVGRKTLSNQTYLLGMYGGEIWRHRYDFSGGLVNTTRVDPDPGTGSISYLYINPFTVSPSDVSVLFVGSSSGVWRCSNVDAIPPGNWLPTTQNYTRIGINAAGFAISALACSQQDNPTLWFGTEVGQLYRLDNAHSVPNLSLATGPLGGGFNGGYVSGISVDPEDPQRVLIGLSNFGIPSLYFTDDGGSTWTDVEGNLAGANGPSVRDVTILSYGGQTYYFAATSTGLYSTDELQGASTVWALEAPDLIGNVVVYDLAARPVDGRLVVGTHGAGVFQLRLDQIVATPPLATATRLHPGVPNPFNPATRLAFELGEAGHVTLAVYDVAGRRVRTLVNGDLPAGPHAATWDGRDDAGRSVASGVYRARLTHHGGEWSRSVTLVK